MRKIDWDKKLTDEDITWLRQSGLVRVNGLETEDAIRQNAENHGGQVDDPEIPEDTTTRSALDPTGRTSLGVVATGETPKDPVADPSAADDDYDQRTVHELADEVKTRNSAAEAEGTPKVEVIGTGTDGKVRKADLVKGLRLHDQETAK